MISSLPLLTIGASCKPSRGRILMVEASQQINANGFLPVCRALKEFNDPQPINIVLIDYRPVNCEVL